MKANKLESRLKRGSLKLFRGIILLLLITTLALLVITAVFTAAEFLTGITSYVYGDVSIEILIGDAMLVLLIIELIRITEIYVDKQRFYLQAVVAAALIAVARQIIVSTEILREPMYIIALAVLILSVAGAYYIIHKRNLEVEIRNRN